MTSNWKLSASHIFHFLNIYEYLLNKMWSLNWIENQGEPWWTGSLDCITIGSDYCMWVKELLFNIWPEEVSDIKKCQYRGYWRWIICEFLSYKNSAEADEEKTNSDQ